MTKEERIKHLEVLIAAAERQVDELAFSLGQANAVLRYLYEELNAAQE